MEEAAGEVWANLAPGLPVCQIFDPHGYEFC